MDSPIRKRNPRPSVGAGTTPLSYASITLIFGSCVIWAALWIIFTIIGWHSGELARHHAILFLAGAAMVAAGAMGIVFAITQFRHRGARNRSK